MSPNTPHHSSSEPEIVDLDDYRPSSDSSTDGQSSTAESPPTSETTPESTSMEDHSEESESQDRIALNVLQVNYTVETRQDRSQYPIIHAFCRNESDEFVHVKVHDFEPYFYVPEEQANEVKQESGVIDIEWGFQSIRGKDLVKVYTDIPRTVGQVKSDYEDYEADIQFPDRFIINTGNSDGTSDMGIIEGISVPTNWDDDSTISVTEDEVEPAYDEVSTKPRVHVLDIEVEDRHGFPDAEEAAEPVISITAFDSYTEEYTIWVLNPDSDQEPTDVVTGYDYISDNNYDPSVRIFATEEALLYNYVEYVARTNPDVLTAWNGDDFDLPYLVNRLDNVDTTNTNYNLSADSLSRIDETWKGGWRGPNIKGRVVFDLLYGFQRTEFTERESYRLEDIGQSELDVGKEEFTGDVGELWETNPDRLIEYNLRDVEICVELDRKQNIINFWDEVRKFVGCRLEDAPTPGNAVDMYVLQKLHGKFALPSKGSQPEGKEFEGGEVLEPVCNIINNVSVLDLKSLYPMCMLTINASPETKVGDDYDGETYEAPNGIEYRKDQEGVIQTMVTELLEEREKKKKLRNECDPESEVYKKYDRQQGAVKVIMNSLFGTLGWDRFRLYDKDNAAAITATGREVIEYTDNTVSDMGFSVVYGDTDSVLISLDSSLSKEEVIQKSEEIEERINDAYDTYAQEKLNASNHDFEIEFEKLYATFLQAAKKKRYAGRVIYKEGNHINKIDIVGFEYQRSDTADITKEAQKKVITMLVSGKDVEEVREYVHGLIEKTKDGSVNLNEIAIPGGIGKQLDNYETETAHVRGAKYANLLLDSNFGQGSKPKRLYLERVQPEFFTQVEQEMGITPQNNTTYKNFKRNPDVICFVYESQVPEEFEPDWQKMISKTLKSPLSRVLRAADITWSEVKEGNSQAGLEQFM